MNCEKTMVAEKYDVDPIDFEILEGEYYLIHKNRVGKYVFRQVGTDDILREFPTVNKALGFYFWAGQQGTFNTTFQV